MTPSRPVASAVLAATFAAASATLVFVSDLAPAAAGDKPAPRRKAPIVADHTCLDVSAIPARWIKKARDDLRVLYGHTSHGSQITSGMNAMRDEAFDFDRRGGAGKLRYREIGGDLGAEGDVRWAATTRQLLGADERDTNVVVWSWCGGASHTTEAAMRAYLDETAKLEKEFPGIVFVHMTGHLDGTGEKGVLHQRNEQIRASCRARNAVLFDFADIESYDPDGKAVLALGADDGCRYVDPKTRERRNWAEEWISAHPAHGWRLPKEAAHTHALNGAMKGRAFWWLLARIAGWDGRVDSAAKGNSGGR